MKTQSFHILMAEDDPTICLVMGMILRRLGHSVEIVHDGREAIMLFTQRPDAFDVLITDHSMAHVSGLELVDHLQKGGFRGKIIVMSGSLNEGLMRDYISRRVDKILEKPFTLEMLSVTLTDLLEKWNGEKPE